MDVVICLALNDFRIIRKTIKYVRLFLQEASDAIYVITKESNRRFYSNKWAINNHVVFLDEDKLAEGLSFKSVGEALANHFKCEFTPGWYLQQFLKMGFAETQYAKKEYLIWDSDTIPLCKIDMYSPNRKYYLAAKTEYHKPYFDTMENLLGFGKQENFSFIAEHMVIDVQIMRELIDRIRHSEVKGKYWFEKIINAATGLDVGAFSEFETYGNYCSKFHPGMFEFRKLNTLRNAGMLFGHSITQTELEALARMGFHTATFEHYDVPFNHRGWINRFDRRLIQIIKWYDKTFGK